MKNIITFGIIAVAIGFVLIVVIAFSIIVLNNSLRISYAQSEYPPGYLQGQILSQQANLPNTQGQFIPPGSPTVLERVLSSNGQQVITICHQPPGNPANRHTIQISIHALDAHLAHGDTIDT